MIKIGEGNNQNQGHMENDYNNQNLESIHKIPDAILAEILLRLPIKSIFKFISVSKRWLSIICDPFFILSYTAKYGSPDSSPWGFIYIKANTIKVAWFVSPGFSTPGFSFDFLRAHTGQPKGKLKILASDNGLFLSCTVVGSQNHIYHVCNPLTMKILSLPAPPRREEWVKIGFVVEKDGSFWVVRAAPFFSSVQSLEFEVFSSKTAAWRCIKVQFPCSLGFFMMARAVVYKGITHWLTEDDSTVAFDPRQDTDSCRIIASPGDFQTRIVGFLGVSCGNLRYCEVSDAYFDSFPYRRHILSTWDLINYETGEWVLVDKTNLSDVWPNYEFVDEDGLSLSVYGMFPEAFHPLDSNVLFLKCSGRLVSYRISTRSLELVSREVQLLDSIFEWHAFAFVLPSWPTPVLDQPSWNAS